MIRRKLSTRVASGWAAAAAAMVSGCPEPIPADPSFLPGEGPQLGANRITQERLEGGALDLLTIRREGRRIFSTPFNKADGFGDGPADAAESPTALGGRPTLQGNGTFLRVNGLDSQSCLECHSVLSTAIVPMAFAVGGSGMGSANALVMPTKIDVTDSDGAGMVTFDGRFINPPFLFGSGGVELLGKEMTLELKAHKETARSNPGTAVTLTAKGIRFGSIRFVDGKFDTSEVEGIDGDLVVRPFGRKGEFATTRGFDLAALQFHMGIQPVEIVGEDVDDDNDGVADELLPGEVSALAIFNTTLEPPAQRPATELPGEALFDSIGCSECHVPALATDSSVLTYSLPENPADPAANVFFQVDLSAAPTQFPTNGRGGLTIALFSDLKRHSMGTMLEESFGSPLDRWYTTARLWGVADSAPYLHDGRALTIGDAILLHGGEARVARENYEGLPRENKSELLEFLRTLRTPSTVGADLGPGTVLALE